MQAVEPAGHQRDDGVGQRWGDEPRDGDRGGRGEDRGREIRVADAARRQVVVLVRDALAVSACCRGELAAVVLLAPLGLGGRGVDGVRGRGRAGATTRGRERRRPFARDVEDESAGSRPEGDARTAAARAIAGGRHRLDASGASRGPGREGRRRGGDTAARDRGHRRRVQARAGRRDPRVAEQWRGVRAGGQATREISANGKLVISQDTNPGHENPDAHSPGARGVFTARRRRRDVADADILDLVRRVSTRRGSSRRHGRARVHRGTCRVDHEDVDTRQAHQETTREQGDGFPPRDVQGSRRATAVASRALRGRPRARHGGARRAQSRARRQRGRHGWALVVETRRHRRGRRRRRERRGDGRAGGPGILHRG